MAIARTIGKTVGLKPAHLKRLHKLSQRRIPRDEIVGVLFGRALMELSLEMHRQLGVLIDRRGEIEAVLIGDAVGLPELKQWRLPTGSGRLRGLRLVHTHVRGEPLDPNDLTIMTLMRLDLVAALIPPEPGEGADKVRIQYAHPVPAEEGEPDASVSNPELLYELDVDFLALVSALEEEFSRKLSFTKDGHRVERAIVVGVTTGSIGRARRSLEELKRLCDTAGLEVVGEVLQRRDKLDPKFVTGSGKLREILFEAMRKQADLLVFDTELSPSQLAALTDATELKILDRTMLILDIFAQHAKSRDGKLQVELAQLKYRMPRLRSREAALSRLTGGIGGRGPGETRLEIDRRRAQDRIRRLERELERLSKHRQVRRRRRLQEAIPQVSIVGYTNAGKSTLLNALTGADVVIEDKLFATLDPTTRRLRLPSGKTVVLTDTVGFIRRLPEDLKRAFKATLEELYFADLLLHVVDASDPARDELMAAVNALLDELGFGEIPILVVFNKVDQLMLEELAELIRTYPDAVFISARTRRGLDELLNRIDQMVEQFRTTNASAG